MVLTFESGGLPLAVPLAQAREVLPAARLLVLPGGRACLHGIVVREGVAVPVVDLKALAGGEPSPPEGPETVILDAGETRLGLLASGADAARTEGQAEEAGDPPEGWTWISGRVMVGGLSFWVLDPEAVARSLGA